MIKVVIADDHAIVRQGLARVLVLADDLQLIAEAKNGWELLTLMETTQVDLVLLDMSIPGPNGVELINRLKSSWPDTPILVFSMFEESHLVANAIKAGATGYLTKDSDPTMIIDAIRHCAAGKHYIHPALGARLFLNESTSASNLSHEKLSSRELQVFLMLARGMSINAIGEQLHISPKTVSTHKFRIMQKLSLNTISELVLYALRHKLIET
ncbi:MAG: response regulator transcription factor [Pseudomonadales bacterium]|nr:response regulator transcription factor [Pseudomonadales bacterium]